MPTDRRYLLILLAFVAGGFLFVMGANAFVDPSDAFGWRGTEGVSRPKTQATSGGGRLYKSIAFLREDYDTLILGTSRVFNSLDPASPVLDPYRAYNMAISAGRLSELQGMLGYTLAHGKLKRVLYGLDFFTFSQMGEAMGDFEYSRFVQPPWRATLYYLTSGKIFLNAVETVWDNAQGRPNENLPDGFRDAERALLAKEEINQREMFRRVFTHNFFVHPLTYAAFTYSPERLEQFEQMVAATMAAGVDLYLFTAPVHARQLEGIDAVGLWPTLEQWKRDLVAIVERHRPPAGQGPRLELWDFTSYLAYNAEPVPQGPQGRMRWYWESSHCTQALGERVLSRLLGREERLPVEPGFGVRLSSENIEQRLDAVRQDQRRYRAEQPAEAAEVRRLAALTRRFRIPERRGPPPPPPASQSVLGP